ncbi:MULTISPECIES: serine--tRNA ligase [Paenibacillus]|uniref:serine--tRNA ligase n=1 Tax=Paenibacillus TaxID=44249 RepID=UPI0021A37833|nr:serine--tRNA ligase [Paenibacillus sp. p3-SID1389]MCT2194320.1 serine--tRNA ligase [Paenibacillus sp. p3-SID1389]
MLDIKWIREHQEQVQTVAEEKGIELSVPELLRWDDQRRALLQETERLRQERNRLTPQIEALIREQEPEAAAALKDEVKQLNRRLNGLEKELEEAEHEYRRLMLLVPNRVSPDTPKGRSDLDNVEVKRVGAPPTFEFTPRDHVALGELHRMIDIPRGVKTAGARNYYLSGAGVLLHRAVQQLAMDLLAAKGFTLLEVPLMVRSEALVNTGFFPLGADQTYRMAEDDRWLVGTAEVPLVSYYDREIVELTQPIKLAAASLCFRSEVGSAGRDVHGLYRVHQFSKVEQVVLCENNLDLSEQLFQEITQNAEEMLQLLELPYRVMAVCTGDMSQKTYKQYDIETWMPSRGAYGETHSSSQLLDFQARRSNIRFKDRNGKLQYCYTLNNTMVASPRILIPLLENHQEEDGSIRIPLALRKYMNGLERLTPLDLQG